MTLPLTLRMVRPPNFDPSRSVVSVNKTTPAADGVDVTTVSLTLLADTNDAEGEPRPIVGALPTFTVSGTGNTLTQPTVPTNASGSTTGSFVSTQAEVKTVTGIYKTETIAGAATVTQGGSAPDPDEGDPFFEETFADNKLNNANGFTWGSPKNTTVVTFDSAPALRFRYDPAASSVNAEQRFNLGRPCPHLCLEYQVHIPSNFTHQTATVTNNKWAMFWRDVYSDVAGGTWRAGFEFTRNAGDSNIRAMSSRWNLNSWTSSNSTGDYLPTGQGSLFISDSGPLVRGAWNTVRIELKAASSQTASDGIQRMWINGTKFVEITTGKFWNFDTATDPADCFLRNGYFMGTANSGYAALTDFHLRGFKFYDSNPGWT